MYIRLISILGLVILLSVPCLGITITVDDDGPADYSSIQNAIDYAWNGDMILVCPGSYGPISFGGLVITVTSVDPDDPNIVNSTVTSSVTFECGETSESILRGFTIKGGGIRCHGSSPSITKNIIRDCLAEGYGGGIRGSANASPTITYNIIKNNRVTEVNLDGRYYAYGGAIYRCHGLIAHNIIVSNQAFAEGTYPPRKNAFAYGGALCECNGIIINNVITQNTASVHYGDSVNPPRGGGLYQCNAIVKNNIITDNIAYMKGDYGQGGGVYGHCQNSYNNVWDNSPDNFAGEAVAGLGTISKAPLFGGPNDFHLKSASGRWDPDANTWVIDEVTSRCIDNGDPADNVVDESEPNGDRINMGAYGGTAQASKTPGISITFPGVVANLIVQGGHKHVVLNWDEPGDNGGSQISGYNIYRGPSGDELSYYYEASGSELSYIDFAVENGNTYYYAVSAVNIVGEGERSLATGITANWNDADLNGDGIINILDLAMIGSGKLRGMHYRSFE